MILVLIVFAIQFGVSGLLLRAACWSHNRWFAGLQPTSQTAETPSASAQEAKLLVEPEREQTNPFAPPRQLAEPATINRGAQTEMPTLITVPTLVGSIGLGFLLTGLQLAVFGISPMVLAPISVFFGRLGIGLSIAIMLVAVLIGTAKFVSVLLATNFNRGLIVSVVYYSLLLAVASPLIVLLLLSFKVPQ